MFGSEPQRWCHSEDYISTFGIESVAKVPAKTLTHATPVAMDNRPGKQGG